MGVGPSAEWLGSIGWDGYPDGSHLKPIFGARTEKEYRDLVEALLANVGHATRPAQGWPWPWESSTLTDWAYTWAPVGEVVGCCFGRGWLSVKEMLDEGADHESVPKRTDLPDMTNISRPTLGPRSGLIIMRAGKIVEGG